MYVCTYRYVHISKREVKKVGKGGKFRWWKGRKKAKLLYDFKSRPLENFEEIENSDLSRKKGIDAGKEGGSNKSVQTIVVKQLKASLVYARFSRGGGRTEMTSPDRETDSRGSSRGLPLSPGPRDPRGVQVF